MNKRVERNGGKDQSGGSMSAHAAEDLVACHTSPTAHTTHGSSVTHHR